MEEEEEEEDKMYFISVITEPHLVCHQELWTSQMCKEPLLEQEEDETHHELMSLNE